MGARSEGRQAALQILYALDASERDGGEMNPVQQAIDDFWIQTPGDIEGRSFADELVRGVMGHRVRIDAQIGQASKTWRLDRMARVDRNVLRLGTWELLEKDVPRAVVIDESVELGKRFGGEGSGVFVNGVLERIAQDVEDGKLATSAAET